MSHQNPYVEALIPRATVGGDKVSKAVIKTKRGPKGGVLINRTGVLIRKARDAKNAPM